MSDTFRKQIVDGARQTVGEYLKVDCVDFVCAALGIVTGDDARFDNLDFGGLNSDAVGPKIDRGDIKSGDLIFFTRPTPQYGGGVAYSEPRVGILDIDDDGSVWMITNTGPKSKVERLPVYDESPDTLSEPSESARGISLIGVRRVNESATTTTTRSIGAANGSAGEWKVLDSYKYTVEEGDTPRSIAQKAGITWQELKAANPALAATKGVATFGQQLTIPFARQPSSVSPAGTSVPNTTQIPVDKNGVIDTVAWAEFIYNELEGSPLIGMGSEATGDKNLADGAIYGVTTGTREQWTKLILTIGLRESGGLVTAELSSDPGGELVAGSHGPFGLSDGDFSPDNDLYKGLLPPMTGKSAAERLALLRDPGFATTSAMIIMGRLLTDASRSTRLGYRNPVDPTRQPNAAEVEYDDGAALARYWRPFRGVSRDGRSTINFSEAALEAGSPAFEAALNNIRAKQTQAAQQARQSPPVFDRSGERINKFVRENNQRAREFERERDPFENQPPPVIDEQLLRGGTVFNFGGGALEVEDTDYGKLIKILSDYGSYAKFNENVQFFSREDISTAAAGSIYTTAKSGGIYTSAPDITNNATGDEVGRTGEFNYGTIGEARDALAGSVGVRNTNFEVGVTNGPLFNPAIAYLLGEHQPVPTQDGRQPNQTLFGEDVPALLITDDKSLPEGWEPLYDQNGFQTGAQKMTFDIPGNEGSTSLLNPVGDTRPFFENGKIINYVPEGVFPVDADGPQKGLPLEGGAPPLTPSSTRTRFNNIPDFLKQPR